MTTEHQLSSSPTQSPPTSPDAQAKPRRMLAALLALNGLLLLVLAAVTFSPAARAQQRPAGDYTMVAGTVKGAEPGVVYIVDSVSKELLAVSYDTANRRLVGLTYRNIASDEVNLSSPRRPRD